VKNKWIKIFTGTDETRPEPEEVSLINNLVISDNQIKTI
jgi:hypothetical protein